MTMQPHKRSDWILSSLFALIGLLFVYEGINLPGPETVSYIEKGGEPGRMPVILGVINLIFALILFFRKPVDVPPGKSQNSEIRQQLARGGLFTGALCVVFALGFIFFAMQASEAMFGILCFLFISIFVVFFEWKERKSTRHLLLSAGTFSLATTITIVVVFEKLLLVPLP
ncbi:tripartite tricarboxylate transporter TctB family protein [Parasalinivibrio latis]|uniref:tripartite tricarboxylate transporter TctB family protein n=1 Tax=Parasalinivibrio latis TaxID=2952610 RepID=UPI0030DF3F1F